MKPWETHLPVLEFLMNTFPIKSVIEFGIGKGSTPFFLSRCDKFTTVEHDEEWFNTADTFLPMIIDFNKYLLPPSDFLSIFKLTQEADLIFIDGEVTTRVPCIHESFNHTNLIVLHDTEEWVPYGYHKIEIPKGWVKFDYTVVSPWTTVYTNNIEYIMPIVSFLHSNSIECFQRPPERFTINFWRKMGRI